MLDTLDEIQISGLELPNIAVHWNHSLIPPLDVTIDQYLLHLFKRALCTKEDMLMACLTPETGGGQRRGKW